MRPEFAEVYHKQIRIGCGRRHLPQQEHPSHLNAHAAAERRAGVQVRSTRIGKTRRDFRKAAKDDAHSNSGQEHGNWAEFSDQARHG